MRTGTRKPKPPWLNFSGRCAIHSIRPNPTYELDTKWKNRPAPASSKARIESPPGRRRTGEKARRVAQWAACGASHGGHGVRRQTYSGAESFRMETARLSRL